MRKLAKKALAIVDSVPVIYMMAHAWSVNDRAYAVYLVIAILMFIWHTGENKWLRTKQPHAHVYPGLSILPHLAFGCLMTVSLVEYILRDRVSLPFLDDQHQWVAQASGVMITNFGICIRAIYISGSRTKDFLSLSHLAGWGFFMIGIGIAIAFLSAPAIIVAMTMLLPSLTLAEMHQTNTP